MKNKMVKIIIIIVTVLLILAAVFYAITFTDCKASVMALTQESPGVISLGAYQQRMPFFSNSETMASATFLFFDE